jgi:hypothetical protein
MTRREINGRFDEIQTQFGGIQKELDQAHTDRTRIESQLINHLHRIEDKVEQLNQNYIDHLAHHNQKD